MAKRKNPYQEIQGFVYELIVGGIQQKAPTKSKKAKSMANLTLIALKKREEFFPKKENV